MQREKAVINYLKQDEAIPGGNKPLYLANNIFRVEPGPKLSEDEGYGIQGFMNTLTIVKSRSNRAGQTMDLVFDQARGYINVFSNLNFLKKEKLVTGAGRSFRIAGCDVSFTQREFPKKLRESKELRMAYKKALHSSLMQFIYTGDEEIADEADAEQPEVAEEKETKKASKAKAAKKKPKK